MITWSKLKPRYVVDFQIQLQFWNYMELKWLNDEEIESNLLDDVVSLKETYFKYFEKYTKNLTIWFCCHETNFSTVKLSEEVF